MEIVALEEDYIFYVFKALALRICARRAAGKRGSTCSAESRQEGGGSEATGERGEHGRDPPTLWRTHVRFMSTEFLKGPPECGDKKGETVHRRITEALYFFQVF